MADQNTATGGLAATELCVIDFEVDGVFGIGASPFGDTRIGYITGGSFRGPRLSGRVLPGGGNWSRGGRLGSDTSVGTFDARAVLQTDDGAMLYLTYTGRTRITDAVRARFAAADGGESVDPADYYLRIAAVFETAAPPYAWLNGILAVSMGAKTKRGVRHRMFEVL